MNRSIEQIKEAVVAGKHKEIVGLVETAVKDQIDLNSIINEGLIEAMDIVGRKFGTGEIYVPGDARGRGHHEEGPGGHPAFAQGGSLPAQGDCGYVHGKR